ncbi:type II secretion system protein GspL [Undibacterium luofuense]|nr:type II secretion system protein GspL [Undibacterium luofuense]
MANLLYISLPPRSVALKDPDWTGSIQMGFALMSGNGQLMQQGHQTLEQIRLLAHGANEIRVLFAASDISVFEIAVPPMNAVRFKAALPNLMEEYLSQDPAELVLAAGPVKDGKAVVSVADRNWVQQVVSLLRAWGVHKLSAYASHLASRSESDAAIVWVEQGQDVTELAINGGPGRISANLLDHADTSVVLQLAQIMLPPDSSLPVKLFVPGNELERWKEIAAVSPELSAWEVQACSWSQRVAGIHTSVPDLFRDIDFAAQPAFDWKRWKWPLILGGAALVVNVFALNLEWLSLKREEKALKTAIVETFRSSFPNEPVQFPLEQMQRKLSAAQQQAGQFSGSDFASVAFRFAQSWDKVMAGQTMAIETMEYKEHALIIKVKSGVTVPVDALATALAEQSLTVEKKSEGVWQVSAGGKKK